MILMEEMFVTLVKVVVCWMMQKEQNKSGLGSISCRNGFVIIVESIWHCMDILNFEKKSYCMYIDVRGTCLHEPL